MTRIAKHNCNDELHNVQLRVTPARLGVLELLERTDVPLDVGEVIRYLRKHNIAADQATVFRILNTFTKKGITRPVQFNEGKFRYEHASKPKHHHFICEKCGSVTDVSGCHAEDMGKQIEKEHGVMVKRHSLEFFGLCRRCRS